MARWDSMDESCPRCSEPRIGLFCEQCGHSYADPVPPTTVSLWWVVIAVDRDYFEARCEQRDRFTFPVSSSPRRVELAGDVVRVGRRSTSRRTSPEIDLAIPPVDPGVSREHARLLAQPDRSWALVDEGSMSGTYLNDGAKPIPAHQQVPLADRDRLFLGIWTMITLYRDP
ncbi:MAG: FHA domain-containing protein [Actinomycetota bacterium]|nr:FHA domain-containing protein [Actinomycetota bacterium]